MENKYLKIKEIAERVLSTDFSDVEIVKSDCVFAENIDGKRKIGGANTPQKLRAFSLLKLNEKNGNFSISQKPKFHQLGVMIDVSRNGVMRVNKVKEYIDYIAMCGANEILLYSEDIYTLEDYPHFGYRCVSECKIT